MAQVVIQNVVPVGKEFYSVRGTVDGRGYVVQVPAKDVDAASGKAAQQMVIAKALKAEDDAQRPAPVDLTGTVTV